MALESVLDVSHRWIEYAARGVEIVAALVIVGAAVQAAVGTVMVLVRRDATVQAKNLVRLNLGRWLALALEFELAADILNTAVTPTWGDIEKLAAIAAIRTALNYFLGKEIDSESSPERVAAENNAVAAGDRGGV